VNRKKYTEAVSKGAAFLFAMMVGKEEKIGRRDDTDDYEKCRWRKLNSSMRYDQQYL